MRALLIRIAVWLSGRKAKSIFVFTRYDGAQADVACCACGSCRNYFFVQNVEIEQPNYCPYCGSRFRAAIPATSEEMKDIQIL
jgi:uncharacterized CHY-type Zn-finger protein